MLQTPVFCCSSSCQIGDLRFLDSLTNKDQLQCQGLNPVVLIIYKWIILCTIVRLTLCGLAPPLSYQ